MAALFSLSACTDALRRPEAETPAPVIQRSRPAPADTPATAPPPAPANSATHAPTAPPAAPSPPPATPGRKRDGALQAGIAAYENGDYPAAQKQFQATLGHGADLSDQILAHKYLAFISCATGKVGICEGHFRRILSLDRNFRLSPAEAGHPQWGPVFRKLKHSRK